MKAKTIFPSLGALAVATLLAASPAQACMPFFSAGPGQASCATPQAQAAPQSCLQSGQAVGQEAGGQSCGLINPDLLAAVGEMAAGGMRIATHMAQVLAAEVSRYAAMSEGVK